MTGLVLLRIVIGWHFLYSGIWKVQTPSFSASGFLSQAKGPLAEHFYAMLPDVDGRKHLDFEAQQEAMKKYADAFVARNQLNEAETAAAREILAAHEVELLDYLTDEVKKKRELKEQFDEHLHKLDRLADQKETATRDIPFQQKRNWDEQTKLRGQAASWSKDVDRIWDQFKADLASVVEGRPARPVPADAVELELVDRLVTYSNIAVGACLIAGLFTRFSALAGALFLAQIVAAQPDWPGMYPAPHPSAGRSLIVNKEFVEMTALIALGFLPTGRWAGLDFFVHNLIVRPLLGKKGAV
ncbi:MAG TPA: hypothetical protein VGN12_22590 [Pirellulales bacterium]